MAQEIAAYVLLGIAVIFLVRKYFFKKKNQKNCGSDDCGCA